MLANPKKHFVYATYNQNRANEVANDVWDLAEQVGLRPTKAKTQWRIFNGAEIKFTSIGGSLTGYPIDGGIIIDDPIKDMADALSATKRKKAISWLDSVVNVRVHPNAWVIVMATRWHPNDLSGYAINSLGWEYVNLKAICTSPESDPMGRKLDEVLWPEKRPLSFLEPIKRANAFIWASLYQGEPRPQGNTVFREPTYYDTLPTSGYRIVWGVDLAYTAKTSADFSVAICCYVAGESLYVVDVYRHQVEAPQFAAVLTNAQTARPGPLLWIGAGPELGVAQQIRRQIPQLLFRAATTDKFVRASPVSEAWNLGKVLVPRSAPWLDELLGEIASFTGVSDAHDDQVDAIASAYLLSTASTGATSYTQTSDRGR